MSEENKPTSNNVNELLRVEFNNDTGLYNYTCPQNVNANEIIFCLAGLIKCFNRDGIMKVEESIELLNKYLSDPQYDELTEVNQ